MGADHVFPRGQLHAWLNHFLTEAAQRAAGSARELGCDQPLSEAGRRGVELIASGQYFEAHEALEHAWLAERGRGGDVDRALLQVAVLYLHISRNNYRGAVKMFLRMSQWLEPLPDRCRGVDVALLRCNLDALRQELDARGPRGIQLLDRTLLRPIPVGPPDR